MVLNAYVAEKRNTIFADLEHGHPPREGEFDEHAFKDALLKGKPQMGTTRFEPLAIILEFIYPGEGSAIVFQVRLATPERVLFMPVPRWVVESIWQGEIDGSYHFESEAAQLLAEYEKCLAAEDNGQWFGPRQVKVKG